MNTTLCIITAIAIDLILCVIPGSIATKKSRSFGAYYAFGVLCLPIAIMTIVLAEPKDFQLAQERLVYHQLHEIGDISEKQYDAWKYDVANR